MFCFFKSPGWRNFLQKKNEVKILFLTFGAYCRGKIGNTPSLFVQIHGFCFRAQKGVVRREVFGYNRTDNLGTKGVMQKMKATLILENGMTFAGRSIGSGEERICEMVFNTSMTGYQEILTDPSYAGQGIVMSYPLIGNYGVNHEDNESTRPWAEAFIVRHLARRGSNFRCEDGLDSYLKQFHITGIEGVDTRALTRILRSQGTMNGMITCAEHFSVPECLERIRAYRVEGTVERVTRREAQVYPALGERRLRVALMDYGVTYSQHINLDTFFGSRFCRFNSTTFMIFTISNYDNGASYSFLWSKATCSFRIFYKPYLFKLENFPRKKLGFPSFVSYR